MNRLSNENGRNISKTTTVGLIAGDYVILAADKRATGGFEIYHKSVRKILRVDDYIAMTISGLVADAQIIYENAKYIAKRYELNTGRKITIHSLSSYLGLILNVYLRFIPYIVQLLIGGYDSNGPQIYYLDLFGTVSREKYMATGSGSPIALGVLEENYRSNMDLEEAVELAYNSVYSAITRDGYSGEGIDIVIIGPGVYREETRLFKHEIISQS
ncbi:MAG: proteasome subunit beta [Desulfurococcaceae archaeon]